MCRAWVYRFFLLLLLGLFWCTQEVQPWIVFMPSHTADVLVPSGSDWHAWVEHPWTQRLSLNRSGGQRGYAVWEPRTPLADWGEVCMTEDQAVLPVPCPYPVFIHLKLSSQETPLPLFPLIQEMKRRHPNTEITIERSPSGTVLVQLPRHRIILGRHYWIERLAMARRILSLPEWRDSFGDLDMRYSDGFAWRSRADLPDEKGSAI